MTSFQDGIPERELTFQYKPLTSFGESPKTPSVADGTEVKIFAESIKEIFQKEPMTQAIQKGPENHFEGDETLVSDTLNAKHTFEITGWVYSNKNGKHSLDNSILSSNGEEAQISTDTVQAEEFNKFMPLGDTGIKYDSESVSIEGGSSLKRGFRKNIASVATSADRFIVNGDETDVLADGDSIRVADTSADPVTYTSYTVDSAAFNGDETEINVREDVTDTSGDKLAANDYGMNYDKGEIRYFDNGNIDTIQKTTEFYGYPIFTRTVISDKFEITYTFDASANNIARLVRRMSQLGNPFVMRLDKSEFTAASGEGARDFLVIPKKIQIVGKSEKPDEYKLEMELRKGTIEQ